VVILFAGVKGYIDKVAVESVGDYETAWLAHVKSAHKAAILDAIVNNDFAISDDIEAKLAAACADFTAGYVG